MTAGLDLIIDADDTLWENNIYFEQAFDDFYDFLAHSSLTKRQVRTIFNEMEIANIRVSGYGSVNFARNLTNCYRHLAERHIRDEDIRHILSLGQRILDQPIEPLPGVADTLEYLAPRHRLTLFTKGDAEEQRLKVDRSGIGHLFAQAEIVREKDTHAYRELARRHGMDPARTWMAGNSPKSDINPALEAGFGAVFIPRVFTWELEHQALQVPEGSRFVEVTAFASLRDYF